MPQLSIGAPPPREGQQGEARSVTRSLAKFVRMLVLWYFVTKFFGPKKPVDLSQLMSNSFRKGELLDMWLYLSEEAKFKDFSNENALVWHEFNVPYAVWESASSRSQILTYHLSEVLQHNESLYAHVFFARSGYTPNPDDPEYKPHFSFGRTHPVVMYLPKPKADEKKSLLGSQNSKKYKMVPEENNDIHCKVNADENAEWISYWKPNITINLVDDFTRYSRHAVPETIADCIHSKFTSVFVLDLNVEPRTMSYYPTIYFNEFWLLRDKFIPLNDTVVELPLYLELGPISMTKWQIFLQMERSFQIQRSYGSMLEGEADELKRVFLEGNPYLLAVTMVVSCLHSVFDFLAFKNDIQFWKKNKSMEGLSAKSIVVNFICQFIIFLYLLDNETSWIILLSSGVGVCIEFWKIGRAMHIEIDRTGRFPMLKFRDRESYTMNKTKEYDDLAMKYLSYISFFLVACSSVYSLLYKQHKSWYSWIVSSLTSCVYMFGFIMMCPQLFINYKMKSVAHLPWRQMTYKFLNTVIDDLFAFVIKMPMLHRLSVFRDDIIFMVYLYQRWIYPVDKNRINEFGFGGEEEKKEENQNLISSDSTAVNTAEARSPICNGATAAYSSVDKRKRKKKKVT